MTPVATASVPTTDIPPEGGAKPVSFRPARPTPGAGRKTGAIIDLLADELEPGSLATAFFGGAEAVIVHFGDRLRNLWAQLVENPEEQLPWQAPPIDIARNHVGSADITKSLGDGVYIQPGLHGYISRKIEIDRTDGEARPTPSVFRQGAGSYTVPLAAMEECCAITDLLMAALTPIDHGPAHYRVAVQRLKYQACPEEFDQLAAVTYNSLARWARTGFRIDVNRARLNPRLARKGVSDSLGFLMLSSAGRSVAGWIDRTFGDPRLAAPAGPNARIVEREHLDERFLSALCGRRDSVCTQIFVDGTWCDLPVTLNSLAVFPGNLAQRAFGLRPTLHRVIYPGVEPIGDIDPRSGNVTMLIGAV